MKGQRWLAALAAVLLAVCCRGETQAEGLETHVFRCLAVGMDLFVTQENTAPCSANNAERAADLFADFLPADARVTQCVNGPSSISGLEKAIREAFGGAGEEDTSLLYLSTHGIRWEEDGTQGTVLVLSDGKTEDLLSPEELRAMLDPVPGKKVLILDCCYAGAFAEAFESEAYHVLVSCGAGERSYFWTAGEHGGTGYFTAAMENALRASDPEQIDPDGDGRISLSELAGRIREIYGVAEVGFWPAEDVEPLFFLPEDRSGRERILGVRFDPPKTENGQISLSFRFRTEQKTKLEYRLVPAGEAGWDFEKAVHLPDRERAGRTRGLLAPGEKERMLRFSAAIAGEHGEVLVQVIAWRGQEPVPECSRRIRREE